MWLPLVAPSSWLPMPGLHKREARWLWLVFGRLKDGVTIESARAEMETIGRRLARFLVSLGERGAAGARF